VDGLDVGVRMAELEKVNLVDGEGLTFVYLLCEQITESVKHKESFLVKYISSNDSPDFLTIYSGAEELSNLYSSMLSMYHEFVRKVARGFKDISKSSEYLVALSMVLRSEGVNLNKRDFDVLISNSFDLYVNISDFLSEYSLFSDKYQKMISLFSKYRDSSIDEDRFVENLKSLIRELSTWRDDLWRFVREIYAKARLLEDSYTNAYRLISHHHPPLSTQGDND